MQDNRDKLAAERARLEQEALAQRQRDPGPRSESVEAESPKSNDSFLRPKSEWQTVRHLTSKMGDAPPVEHWTPQRTAVEHAAYQEREALLAKKAEVILSMDGWRPEVWGRAHPEKRLETIRATEKAFAALEERPEVPVQLMTDATLRRLKKDTPMGAALGDPPFVIELHPALLRETQPTAALHTYLHEEHHVEQSQADHSLRSRPDITGREVAEWANSRRWEIKQTGPLQRDIPYEVYRHLAHEGSAEYHATTVELRVIAGLPGQAAAHQHKLEAARGTPFLDTLLAAHKEVACDVHFRSASIAQSDVSWSLPHPSRVAIELERLNSYRQDVLTTTHDRAEKARAITTSFVQLARIQPFTEGNWSTASAVLMDDIKAHLGPEHLRRDPTWLECREAIEQPTGANIAALGEILTGITVPECSRIRAFDCGFAGLTVKERLQECQRWLLEHLKTQENKMPHEQSSEAPRNRPTPNDPSWDRGR